MAEQEEKATVGAFVATALADPTEANIEGAIGALAAATEPVYLQAMSALHETYPAKHFELVQFDAMVRGLRSKLRAG